MANYLYRTALYTDTTNVIGLNVSQNNTDLADYEDNYQASTIKISEVQVSETTFLTELDYTDFKALIVSPIAWTDIKEADHGNHYELYLLSDSPL